MDALPNIIKKLARELGSEITNNRLDVPEKYGRGYCLGYVFNEHIRMIISNFELYDDLDFDNPEIDNYRRLLFFKFKNVFPGIKTERLINDSKETPSVLIATSKITTEEIISVHSNIATINIEVEAEYLKEIFNCVQESFVLQNLIENKKPLLFEQLAFPPIQNIIDEILTEYVEQPFELAFKRNKAEELIIRLLMELEKRDEKRLYALNGRDIETLYRIRNRMLENLDTPPVIAELADSVNMSSSKLKRLFKQVFGNSIFNYYQEFRIREAARLLKDEKLTVSDVGYHLGYTNLSHFSRVFKRYYGMNPKRYSTS